MVIPFTDKAIHEYANALYEMICWRCPGCGRRRNFKGLVDIVTVDAEGRTWHPKCHVRRHPRP